MSIGCLLNKPLRTLNLQPRYVPWPGIQPMTFHFAGWCPTNWASLVRVKVYEYLLNEQIIEILTEHRLSIQLLEICFVKVSDSDLCKIGWGHSPKPHLCPAFLPNRAPLPPSSHTSLLSVVTSPTSHAENIPNVVIHTSVKISAQNSHHSLHSAL